MTPSSESVLCEFSEGAESAEATAVAREIAEDMVIRWKESRQLHDDFGGVVVFQQSNPLELLGA